MQVHQCNTSVGQQVGQLLAIRAEVHCQIGSGFGSRSSFGSLVANDRFRTLQPPDGDTPGRSMTYAEIAAIGAETQVRLLDRPGPIGLLLPTSDLPVVANATD